MFSHRGPLPGEQGLYGQFRLLLDAASKDPDLKKVLVDTAIETEEKVIKPFFLWKHNGRPAGNGWNRSTNNAQFGIDYFNRTGTSKSNMFDNRPTETQYFYTDYDGAGGQLAGSSSYEITFAPGQEPPVNGFWSLTLYNDKHLFHPNNLKRYSLGTKNKNLKRSADGSLMLYAGGNRRVADKESNWLPAPDGPSHSTSEPTGARRASSTVRGSRRLFGKSASEGQSNVRCWPLADVPALPSIVRFRR